MTPSSMPLTMITPPRAPATPMNCVVSGANSGIGLEVTAGLRERGCNVVMACRCMSRCAAAKAELDGRGLPGSCECLQLDLSDAASVRAFAHTMESRGSRIHTLVNNAGVMGVGPTPNGDNAHNFANAYAPFLLTRLLLPLMAAHGRVVNVGSEAHRRASISSTRLGGTSPLEVMDRSANSWYLDYARSKLYNLLHTVELSRRLKARGSTVTAYCVSPGRVSTNIFENVPGLLRPPLKVLAGLFFQTPKQGARTVLKAATDPQLQGKHVLYMHAMKEAVPAAAAKDTGLAADLWQRSLQVVGLTKGEDARLWPKV